MIVLRTKALHTLPIKLQFMDPNHNVHTNGHQPNSGSDPGDLFFAQKQFIEGLSEDSRDRQANVDSVVDVLRRPLNRPLQVRPTVRPPVG